MAALSFTCWGPAIPFNGRSNPVKDNTIVWVRTASQDDWIAGNGGLARSFNWEATGPHRITEYKVRLTVPQVRPLAIVHSPNYSGLYAIDFIHYDIEFAIKKAEEISGFCIEYDKFGNKVNIYDFREVS